jgi:hypothetical protein
MMSIINARQELPKFTVSITMPVVNFLAGKSNAFADKSVPDFATLVRSPQQNRCAAWAQPPYVDGVGLAI